MVGRLDDAYIIVPCQRSGYENQIIMLCRTSRLLRIDARQYGETDQKTEETNTTCGRSGKTSSVGWLFLRPRLDECFFFISRKTCRYQLPVNPLFIRSLQVRRPRMRSIERLVRNFASCVIRLARVFYIPLHEVILRYFVKIDT